MGDDELAWMRRVGESVRERTRLRTRGIFVADRALLALRLARSWVDLVADFAFRWSGTRRRNG